MATRTATIYASASAYVTTDSPNTVDNSKAVTTIGHNSDTDQSLGYEMFVPPKDSIGRRFVTGTLHIYGEIYTITWPVKRSSVSAIVRPWDPKKTTWNGRPVVSQQNVSMSFTQWELAWADLETKMQYLERILFLMDLNLMQKVEQRSITLQTRTKSPI